MRNTSRTRRSPGKTNANQNGRTARRSITPSGLEMNSQRALRSLECRCGARSAATQTRSAYSTVKTTSDNSSIAMNSGPYCACNAGTESSVIVTRFVTIRTTMSRPTMRPVRSPIVPCSRISYRRRRRSPPLRQIRRGIAELYPNDSQILARLPRRFNRHDLEGVGLTLVAGCQIWRSRL
jgi:hypothetical protein